MSDISIDPTHYTYRVSWAPEDQEFVGTCLEFPSLSWLASNQSDALVGIEQLVSDVVHDMEASDEQLPVPISERQYSGKFQVRMSSHLHRRLVERAAEEKVSLNRFVEEQLAESV